MKLFFSSFFTTYFLTGILAMLLTGCAGLEIIQPSNLDQAAPRTSQDIALGTTLPELPPSQKNTSKKEQKLLTELDASKPFELYWPVDKAQLTQRFKVRKRRRRKGHQGIDLAARRKSPIYAAHDGVVVYVGSGYRGYGKLIIIEYNNHQANWATFYAHLTSYLVKQGDLVKEGTKVGLMGRSGRATGTHLHFELRKNLIAVDPIPYLEKKVGTGNQI